MAPPRFKPKRVRPPRKSTVTRRREEKAALLCEIEKLRKQLSHARRGEPSSPPPPPPKSTCHDATAAVGQLYYQLQQAKANQDLWAAGLRGFVRSYEASQLRPPLRIPLVLSTDPTERRETLRQCHATKIPDAYAYVLGQCGSMDLSVPYKSVETFQDPVTGIQRTTSLEIQPFPGIYSLRRVFDAMKYWMSNVELCITDELGAVTIREDDEDDGTAEWGDASYSSLRRVRSMLACGVPLEGNYAVFRQFCEPEGRAVTAIQSVDEDPMYPYHTDACVKLEITGAIVISQPTPESCVTLARWATLQLVDRVLNSNTCGEKGEETAPVAATSERAVAIAQDVLRWFEILHNVLRERVYADP